MSHILANGSCLGWLCLAAQVKPDWWAVLKKNVRRLDDAELGPVCLLRAAVLLRARCDLSERRVTWWP